MLVEQWFKHYGAPKEVHSDEDVRICCDTRWYNQVLDALNVHLATGVPYTHTSNPLCEGQNCVVQQNLRILMEQERTKDWVLKPVRTPVAILGSVGVCIYVPASRHWLISYSPIHLT